MRLHPVPYYSYTLTICFNQTSHQLNEGIGSTVIKLLVGVIKFCPWCLNGEIMPNINSSSGSKFFAKFTAFSLCSYYIDCESWTSCKAFLNGPIRPLFVYFRFFNMTQFKYKLIKAEMVCLGLEPGLAGLRCRQIHWAMVAPHILQSLVAKSLNNMSKKVCSKLDCFCFWCQPVAIITLMF